MCLIKKSLIPRITRTNKTVYKVVVTHKLSGNIYTPHLGINVKINDTYKGVFYRKKERLYSLFSKEISSGFIHVCATLKAAEKYKTLLSYCADKKMLIRIVMCTIPKNTLYYIGYNDDIATRKLTYIGFVE